MALLKQGDSGPNVLELQQRLKQLGFNPGKLDGDFGPGTEAAVMAFQKSEGLLVDGAVGPRTLKQLGFAGDTQMPSIVAGVKFGAELGMGDGLTKNPDLANDSRIAAQLLARFIKSKERQIKEALIDRNLPAVRKLVNGGSHGLDAFTEAFAIGENVLPPEDQAATAGAA